MPLKKIGIFVFLVVISGKLYSQQQTADLGLFIGGGTPITDYEHSNILQSLNLDYGIYYRYNFNSRIGLRFNALYGTMNQTGYLTTQPVEFKKNVFDFDALVEINYLDFLIGVEKMKFSPFVFTGIGITVYPDKNGNSTITPNIPIGIGAKYALGKYFSVGAEASLHKLMDDGLDNLDNPYSNDGLIKVSDIVHNNDWISYFGLTLTYKFYWGRMPCPVYEAIN